MTFDNAARSATFNARMKCARGTTRHCSTDAGGALMCHAAPTRGREAKTLQGAAGFAMVTRVAAKVKGASPSFARATGCPTLASAHRAVGGAVVPRVVHRAEVDINNGMASPSLDRAAWRTNLASWKGAARSALVPRVPHPMAATTRSKCHVSNASLYGAAGQAATHAFAAPWRRDRATATHV